MPSKGIVCYTYISVDGYTVEFSVPKQSVTMTAADNFTSKNLEMESSNIPGMRKFTGRFQWQALKNGEAVVTRYNNINTFTGKLESGDMISTEHFQAIDLEDALITFGFYDAGHGEAGLTNRDQCYVTICSTANAHWMATVAPPGSREAQKPFSRFVLAAPHDNGMNSMTNADAVLSLATAGHVPGLRSILPGLHFFENIPDGALVHMLPHIVYGVSITQKKEISMMLALGARYFEFRPAKLLSAFREMSALPDTFYFQHACIPGIAFDHFLEEQVAFLDANPSEIVTIHIRYDNIVSGCQRPTNEEIADILTAACSKAQNAPLTWTDRTAFSQSIDRLRSNGQRLICVIMAEKYDTWTAAAYATLHAPPIIERFESMTTEGQESTDLTVLQCQATSQSIKEVLVYSVLSSNAATSCLTSTKADLDTHTLPWIRQHALDRLKAEKTIVIMNDFIDGATTDTSIMLSKQRLAMP